MSDTATAAPEAVYDGDLDVRKLGLALWRRKLWIIVPTILVGAIAAVGVNLVTPKYKSEARILYDGRENIFLRPEAEKSNQDRAAADPETLASQVQLVLSRELANDVIAKLKLNERPEFDPVLRGVSLVKTALVLAGISRDPLRMSPEERVLEAYYERLTAYSVEKSRVIVVEFQSADPELAAQVTNVVVEGYLHLQQEVKQDQTRAAGNWLSEKIEDLRRKVAEAEAKAEDFRGKTSLFVGANNTSLSNQQLGEFTSRLAAARGRKSDAETRARLIRDMLRKGEEIDASDIVNSERIRRLAEQRTLLRAQLAEQSSTLLDGHPRIKELRAQLADFDRQMRSEAEMLVRALESDARIADQTVVDLSRVFEGLKIQAASTNQQDVQLRALDREAKAQRELLESYLAKYREATARDSIGAAPADARIISRAIVSNTPYFPKKLPMVLVAALSTLVVCAGFVTTGELLRSSPMADARAAGSPVGSRVLAPTHPALGVAISAIDDLARRLRMAGEDGRRVAVLGASRNVGTTLTALTLARALARDARVVLIDLSLGAPNLAAISSDPAAPGISDLACGAASFGDIVTRDRLSRLHLVAAGHNSARGQAVLASPRLAMVIEAMARTYDHVVIDGGAVTETDVARMVLMAPRAVLVTSTTAALAGKAGRELLDKVGFAEITVLDGAPIIAAGTPEAAAA